MSEKKPEAEGAAPAATDAAAKPKSKKKLIIIIAVVLLLVVGGAGFMLLGSKKPVEANTSEHEQEKEKHYELAQLDPIIVNLGESTSFLKVTMLIQYDPEVLEKAEAKKKGGHAKGGGHGGGMGGGEEGGKKGGLPEAMAEKTPMLKDAIIRVLSSKRSEEVLTTDGKEKLKEELIESINEALGFEEPAVVGVFFTEFIIQ